MLRIKFALGAMTAGKIVGLGQVTFEAFFFLGQNHVYARHNNTAVNLEKNKLIYPILYKQGPRVTK